MKIKTKLILWYTLLVALLLAVVLIFLFTAGGKILFVNAENILREQTNDMSDEIDFDDGKIKLDDDFRMISKGVQFAVYQHGQLMAGQPPSDLSSDATIQAGVLRRIGAYLVYDLSVSEDVVLRGCYSTETLTSSGNGIMLAAIIAAPILLIIAALGGRIITVRAFAPIDMISKTASNIQNGGDLKARISLLDTGDEVSSLGKAFDGMLDRLDDSFQAEKQFSSDVSHELRTPIAVIQSQCEYALSGVDETSVRGALQEIHTKAKDMAALVARLLELSRAEHGSSSVKLCPVDISELAEIVAEELADAAAEKQIKLFVSTQSGLMVNGEQTLLLRLLLNLTGNAIKYTPKGGSVQIKAEHVQNSVTLRVIDDGIGIAPEHLDKIFRRFYRADASRSREEKSENSGYGLGLSLCKWIADVHNASISVQSIFGKGSTFTVVFPP